MTYPAKTVLAFGLYLLGLGALLVLAPNLLLSAFGIPATPEVWIRVVGMLVLELGVCYVAAARGNWQGFIQLTIPLRLSVIFFFAAFVLLARAPSTLVLFGAADFAFALWTWTATRSVRQAEPRSAPIL